MAIKLNGVNFSYQANSPILKDVSCQIADSRFTAILGKNGSGKTTLFKCILRLLKPSSGQIYIKNHNTKDLTNEQLAGLVAYVPQIQKINFNYTAIEIVEMGQKNLKPQIATEKAYSWLEKLSISHLAQKGFLELSGGQRQLVLIAQALMQEAKILCMDEPTNHLDYGNQLRILSLCKKLTKQGYTIFITTHQPQDVLNFCDDVLVLSQGNVIASGPVEATLTPKLLKDIYDVTVTIDYLSNHHQHILIPKLEDL